MWFEVGGRNGNEIGWTFFLGSRSETSDSDVGQGEDEDEPKISGEWSGS